MLKFKILLQKLTKAGLELKIHGVNRIASLVDEKKLIRREVVSRIDKIFDPDHDQVQPCWRRWC